MRTPLVFSINSIGEGTIFMMECPICNESFSSERELRQHMTSHPVPETTRAPLPHERIVYVRSYDHINKQVLIWRLICDAKGLFVKSR